MATVHLHPYNPDTNQPNNSVQTLFAVASTGLLILLLAGINFVNLVTARATRRAVEVGVRKGLGALRSQLVIQFMGKSLGYSLLGMFGGVGLAALFLPRLNAFSGPADRPRLSAPIRCSPPCPSQLQSCSASSPVFTLL